MTSKRSLGKGSSMPPLEVGKLRLYSMRMCPYAERVRLLADYKKIDFEIINIDIYNKPDWYFSINPAGKVPTLTRSSLTNGTDFIIRDSAIIFEFLDKTFQPDKSVWPKDPLTKAKQQMLIEDYFGSSIGAFFGILQGDNTKVEVLLKNMADLDKSLANKQYFSGDVIGAVDFIFWPLFERLEALKSLKGIDVSEGHSNLSSWISRMKEIPTIQRQRLPTEIHAGYFKERAENNGVGNVDYGLD